MHQEPQFHLQPERMLWLEVATKFHDRWNIRDDEAIDNSTRRAGQCKG